MKILVLLILGCIGVELPGSIHLPDLPAVPKGLHLSSSVANDGERGLFTLRPRKLGEILFEVPVSSSKIFSRQTAREACPWLQSAFDELAKDKDKDVDDLVGYCVGALAETNRLGEYEALQRLPRRCMDGQDFAAEIADYFPAGSYETAITWCEDVRERHSWLLSRLANEHHIPLPVFAWGNCVVHSRGFSLDGPSGEASNSRLEEDLGSHVLIAGADLMNHHREHTVEFAFDETANQWRFRTRRALDAGDELLISYGCHSSLEMLLTYGFVPKSNIDCESVLLQNARLSIVDDEVHYAVGNLKIKHVLSLVRHELQHYYKARKRLSNSNSLPA